MNFGKKHLNEHFANAQMDDDKIEALREQGDPRFGEASNIESLSALFENELKLFDATIATDRKDANSLSKLN